MQIAFIGGGNMASAILGGLIRQGTQPSKIWVVEPDATARARLQETFQVNVLAAPGVALADVSMVIWAVKPQVFHEAATGFNGFSPQSLHLSVAAGIPSESISRWLRNETVVRAMPNTPALVGQGMTGLFARAAVTQQQRAAVEEVLAPTGKLLWIDEEAQLDAVTALSGSGPAYVFYFLEAMTQAGTRMGLSADKAYQLALGTFSGATALAAQSTESPEVLRQRVTSKGGTTYAAITSMDQSRIKEGFVSAIEAACQRATEMGREFGAS